MRTEKRGHWRGRYLDRFYHSRPNWVDGTTEYHALLRSVVGGEILEIGPGPDNSTTRLLASLGTVHGVDPDPAVETNPHLASATVITDGRLPFSDASVDVCVSNYVVEHVSSPRQHLEEVQRVLRPGGRYVFRTPNRWHYVYLVASITPYSFHRLVANRLRALPPDAHEPYPTVYGMNTASVVRNLAAGAGLTVDLIRLVEKEPSYGLAARTLFMPMMAYERVVNSSPAFAGLRSTLLVVLRRD